MTFTIGVTIGFICGVLIGGILAFDYLAECIENVCKWLDEHEANKDGK